jgi:hypothetical protein
MRLVHGKVEQRLRSIELLLNNSVGRFEVDPSLDGRLRSYNASIEQMLWPEKRLDDGLLGDKIPGIMDRTTTRGFLKISRGYLPNLLLPFYTAGQEIAPWVFGSGGIELGPIPKGTPVGLLADLNPLAEDPTEQPDRDVKLAKLVVGLTADLKKLVCERRTGGRRSRKQSRSASGLQ